MGPASFANEAKLASYFESHCAEFGVNSADEYLQVGRDIIYWKVVHSGSDPWNIRRERSEINMNTDFV